MGNFFWFIQLYINLYFYKESDKQAPAYQNYITKSNFHKTHDSWSCPQKF